MALGTDRNVPYWRMSHYLILLSLWTLLPTVTEGIMPTSLGCSLDTVERTIRCRGNNIDYIVRAAFVLVPEPKTTPSPPTTESPTTTIAAPSENTTTSPPTNSSEVSAPTVRNDTLILDDGNETENATTVDDDVPLSNNSSETLNTTTIDVTANNDSSMETTTVAVTSSTMTPIQPTTPPPIEPTEMDIYNCDVSELPNIFSRFNSSLRRIRVARSGVQQVFINAFAGLENKLQHLDLSGNRLLTVPLAIQNLTRLEVLNLRDNKIQVIAEGPTFTNTIHLRELYLEFNNLGFIDNSKLQLLQAPPKGPNRKGAQHSPIGLAVFNLGNTTNSLEILSVRGNGMHSYPDQLMKDFPRLKLLDLSFNSLIDIPEDAFRSMPELQFVNLDSNLIRTVHFSWLPQTLKVFTMKNNPLRCDCDIKWIVDWIFTNTSLTVLLPKCSAPFHLHDTSLLRLTAERLCNQSSSSRQVVYVTDRDISYFPLGVFQSFTLLDVRGQYRSIFLSWKIDPQFYLSQRDWIIIYRRLEDNDIYTFNKTAFFSRNYIENQTADDWRSGERVFSDIIRNLTANKLYQVCMAVVENSISYIHLNHCMVSQPEKEVTPPVAVLPTAHTPETTTEPPPPQPDYLVESKFIKIANDATSITLYWNVIVQSTQSLNYRSNQTGNSVRTGDAGNSDVSDAPKKPFPVPSGSLMLSPAPLESPLALNTLSAIYNELQWRITYRKFATRYTTGITISKNNYVVTGPNTHQYTIANLNAGTAYMICFETLGGELETGYQNSLVRGKKTSSESGGATGEKERRDGFHPPAIAAALKSAEQICKEVVTTPLHKFPSSEVAASSIISILVTALVVSGLWCLIPRMLQGRGKKDDDDPENCSQQTSHTDTGGDEDEEEEDTAGDILAKRLGITKPNGHLPTNNYPRIPPFLFKDPLVPNFPPMYQGSFRSPNGYHMPPSPPSPLSAFPPATNRNGTYPRSILKKSPSAPVLCEAVRPPVSILKKPTTPDATTSRGHYTSGIGGSNESLRLKDNTHSDHDISLEKESSIKKGDLELQDITSDLKCGATDHHPADGSVSD